LPLNFIIHFYWVGIKFHWFKFKLNAIYEELRPLCTITSVFIGSSLEQNVVQLLPPDVKKEINCTHGPFFLCFVILWIEKSDITFTYIISPKPSALIQEAVMNFYGIISYDMFHSHTLKHILKFRYRHIYISLNTLCPKHFRGHCYPLSPKLLRPYRFTESPRYITFKPAFIVQRTST
jgi:hypothetical protein